PALAPAEASPECLIDAPRRSSSRTNRRAHRASSHAGKSVPGPDSVGWPAWMIASRKDARVGNVLRASATGRGLNSLAVGPARFGSAPQSGARTGAADFG